MYYPFLRGKQFDLLALNVLLKEGLLSRKIIPVIEPVRDSATLKKTVELFDKAGHPLYLIDNPLVGTYRLFEEKKFSWECAGTAVQCGHFVSGTEEPAKEQALLIFDTEFSPRRLEELRAFKDRDRLILIPDEGRYRQCEGSAIVLQEAFKPCRRVEDYSEAADQFFSDEHLFFAEDGYQGFSDYTIEGKKYFDKGGPSRAIALHITYLDAYLNLRVRHFVSDSNEDAKEQGRKFFEALTKCREWYERNQDQLLLTRGLEELLGYLKLEKFPGLGTIKKWSLAHHLELAGAFLDAGDHWLSAGRKRRES